MRCAGNVIATASRVYFHFRCDSDGRPAPEKDKHGRVLVDIYVEMNDEWPCFIARGSCRKSGAYVSDFGRRPRIVVFHAMRQAKADKLGFFHYHLRTDVFPSVHGTYETTRSQLRKNSQ